MTEHEKLLAALSKQTEAMLELAESNRQLAASNAALVDYLINEGEDDQAPSGTYLDGSRR